MTTIGHANAGRVVGIATIATVSVVRAANGAARVVVPTTASASVRRGSATIESCEAAASQGRAGSHNLPALCEFADNTGVIGPVVCAKLAKDFHNQPCQGRSHQRGVLPTLSRLDGCFWAGGRWQSC